MSEFSTMDLVTIAFALHEHNQDTPTRALSQLEAKFSHLISARRRREMAS